MLFKINTILFRVAILLCIIYCSGSLITAYDKMDKLGGRTNVIITQASFQPVFINLWGVK